MLWGSLHAAGDAIFFNPLSVPEPTDQGHVCSNSDWRLSMRLLEYERASWFHCLLTRLQETEAHSPHTTGKKSDIILSLRNSSER